MQSPQTLNSSKSLDLVHHQASLACSEKPNSEEPKADRDNEHGSKFRDLWDLEANLGKDRCTKCKETSGEGKEEYRDIKRVSVFVRIRNTKGLH